MLMSVTGGIIRGCFRNTQYSKPKNRSNVASMIITNFEKVVNGGLVRLIRMVSELHTHTHFHTNAHHVVMMQIQF